MKKSHSQKYVNIISDENFNFDNSYNPPFKRPQQQFSGNPQHYQDQNVFQYQKQKLQQQEAYNHNQFQNKQNFQQNYHQNYPQQNFIPNQNYPQNPNYNNNVTNNMNNLSINYNMTNNPHYIDLPSPQGSQQFFNQNNRGYHSPSHVYHSNDQYNSFDNNSSNNNSFDETITNFMTLRPTPKKTQSDKNVTKMSMKANNQNDNSKSLFKEKNGNNSSNEEINLADYLNNVNLDWADFIRNQKGSRILQKELNTISPENLELMLQRLCPRLTEIMVDTYGNYFSQRLIQCCSPQQRLQILKAVRNI
jgi:hypothetical protein